MQTLQDLKDISQNSNVCPGNLALVHRMSTHKFRPSKASCNGLNTYTYTNTSFHCKEANIILNVYIFMASRGVSIILITVYNARALDLRFVVS